MLTADPDRDTIMESVVDKLGTWDDEQIDRHLADLRAAIEAAGDHAEPTVLDVELACWAEALREFHDSLS